MFSDCFQTALWCPQNTSSGPLWSWIVLCVTANCVVLGGSPLPRPYRAASPSLWGLCCGGFVMGPAAAPGLH